MKTTDTWRLFHFVITEYENGELWWHQCEHDEVGMLSGHCWIEGDTLGLRSWSVRAAPMDEFHTVRLAAPAWTRTKYVEIHGVKHANTEGNLSLN